MKGYSMNKKLDWDYREVRKIDNAHLTLGGDEILGIFAPPHGYCAWITASLDEYDADIILWGYGNTEDVALEDLQLHIDKFMKMFYG